jgi:hypothetical protein
VNTSSVDNTSELRYHTARNALDNIMEKLYLVIEHKCCEPYCQDFLDVVTTVKNTGKRVYGIFFINHASSELKNILDRRLSLEKEWISKIRNHR